MRFKMKSTTLKLVVLHGLVALVLGCDVPIQHYLTMKCTPVPAGTNCPERFDCPSITNHDNSKCYFNGKKYAIGEVVPDEISVPQCLAGCFCESASPFAKFRCAHIECPEFIQRFDYDNCIKQHKINSCCSSGKVCGAARNKLTTCNLDGEQYLAGQRMEPKSNKCRTCICHVGFNENNIQNDPNCYETPCGFEFHYANKVYRKAAPVYWAGDCCPSKWREAEASDKLVRGSSKNTNPQLQCHYGKFKMNVGDELEPVHENQYTYKCKCQIPPLAQCVVTGRE